MSFRTLLLAIILFACLPVTMLASEVAAEAPVVPVTGNWILDVASVFAMVLGTILTKWLTSYLSAKREEAKKRLEDTTLSSLERMRYEVEAIIYEVVGNINQKHLPVLISAVAAKKIQTVDDVKQRLRALGDEALNEVIAIAQERGIDAVAVLGKRWIVSKIRSVVDEKSPFLGDTAESLINGGADLLVSRGSEWLKSIGANTGDAKIVAVSSAAEMPVLPAPTSTTVNG